MRRTSTWASLTLAGLFTAVSGCHKVAAIDGDTASDASGDSDSDTDSDTGSIACDLGTYDPVGDAEVYNLADLEALAGYTAIAGGLIIVVCEACTDLNALVCLTSVEKELSVWGTASITNIHGLHNLTSVGEGLTIESNDALTNLEGLNALTSLGELHINLNDALTNLDGLNSLTSAATILIANNAALPDCEVCELLDQLSVLPPSIFVHDNLVDSCTPAPTAAPTPIPTRPRAKTSLAPEIPGRGTERGVGQLPMEPIFSVSQPLHGAAARAGFRLTTAAARARACACDSPTTARRSAPP